MTTATGKKRSEKPPFTVVDSEILRNGHTILQVVPIKKKKPGTRLWMRFDISGVSELLELDRNGIMQRSWIPARDLRILGPVFSQSAQILARERAMVVNMEFVKAIVTSEDLYLLDATTKAVHPFIEQLKEQFPVQSTPQGLEGGLPEKLIADRVKDQFTVQICSDLDQEQEARQDGRSMGQLNDEFASQSAIQVSKDGRHETAGLSGLDDPSPKALVDWNGNGIMKDEELPDKLPFEFRVLEIALDVVSSFLQAEVNELELKAIPALNELTRVVTASNLELVRSLKTNLTHLTARVQKVRDELEQLLNDDGDMADLYLTRKAEQWKHIGSPSFSLGVGPRSIRFRKALSFNDAASLASTVSVGDVDVEELEMLLEAYFLQLDATHNKLTVVRQYIDDTEDYVNIQLDHQRNQLFQFQITLSTVGLALGVSLAGCGIVSMNIPISLYESPHTFKPALALMFGLSFFVFSGVIAYVRWKGLFER